MKNKKVLLVVEPSKKALDRAFSALERKQKKVTTLLLLVFLTLKPWDELLQRQD